MSDIKKFTTKDATITIDSATTLQFNHNKCYQINAPFIFAVAYRCKEYVLLHELQGFITDKIIEPKTSKEFQKGLHNKENPFYLDVYDSVFERLTIENESNGCVLKGYDIFGRLKTFKNDSLNYFHLFSVDDNSYNELPLDFKELKSKGSIEWSNFANGMIER